jgi:hypothetical protein
MKALATLRTTILLAAMLLLAAGSRPSAQLPSLADVMRDKADNAQKLLRPLVLADFTGINTYADRLGRITYTEVASWQRRGDPEYVKQANAFLAAVRDLREASGRRDAEAAGRAYSRLVSSCIGCHQETRASRSASIAVPSSGHQRTGH